MAVPSGAGGRSDPAAEPDAFEFFSSRSPGSSPPMCAAADVFLDGKIVPFGAPPPKQADVPSVVLRWLKSSAVSEGSGRRSRFWGSAGAKPEYRKLRKASNCDGNALPQSQAARQRPGWHLCVLGSVRLPAKTDMSDIRSRQRRRSAAAEACARSDGDVVRGAWRLLQSLSCTALESATDVAPLRLTSHVHGA
ncbi:hypothetical protein OPV22_018752 [Ensete ventricosum]|uniref:Uncharacterized protein n=1 Tax=Ensete ventricosum TaxID=4639 RepID=A0AAV8R409_ENSVE|nr:hypothetical protein OPV22_018752 [Ensete ventricosum]